MSRGLNTGIIHRRNQRRPNPDITNLLAEVERLKTENARLLTRLPRIITDRAELEAFPNWTIIADNAGGHPEIFMKRDGEWHEIADVDGEYVPQIFFPATVVYQPEEEK